MDQVILVDELDHEIGVMDKIGAHRGEGKLHRAVSVFLFNESGKLLVQQRSHKKIVGALQWANTCCGNVRPGETYEECARRRLREELGIDESGNNPIALQQVTTFLYQVRCNEEFSEHEMDTVFVGTYTGNVDPNPDEVAAYQWIEFEKLLKLSSLVPWVQIMDQKGIVQKIKETLWN